MKIGVAAALAVMVYGLAAGNAGAADSKTAPKFPWAEATEAVNATTADLRKSGLQGIQPHAADLDRLLTAAAQSYTPTFTEKGTTYILTDGPSEALIAMAAVAAGKSKTKAAAAPNPYPPAALYLASYYNETRKSEDALRILDLALALPGAVQLGDTGLGEHLPLLTSERGAALTALKRWPEALANYDKGLTISGLKDPLKAIMQRGRGFALTELGRLDDAAAAYQDSLKTEPGNARVLNELKYIAKLKSGGAPASSGLGLVQPPPAAKSNP